MSAIVYSSKQYIMVGYSEKRVVVNLLHRSMLLCHLNLDTLNKEEGQVIMLPLLETILLKVI
jgi:hypothetical protein